MKTIRLISRLDIKAPFLVKGVQFEGLRKLGDPNEYALKYYKNGIDEIFYIDIVASLYNRNTLTDIISKTTKEVFVPITVGGGLRNLFDIEKALRAGADKVSLNTAAIKDPNIINEASKRFGSSCIVLSIEAKKNKQNYWEAYYDNGREHSGLNVIDWVKEAENRGAGEILVTSVDRDGTRKGFDIELVEKVSSSITVPLVVSGGLGKLDDITQLKMIDNISGIAIGSSLHYDDLSVKKIREHCKHEDIPIRQF